ncbi:MAG: MarR family transcriptional regulator [Longicatena sp.]
MESTNLEAMLKQAALFRKVHGRVCFRELASYNFSPSEIDILIIMSNNPNINTAKEFVFYLNISKGLVCRSVDALLKRGLLEAHEDKYDKRIQRLILKDCDEIISKIKYAKQTFEKELLKGIHKEDLDRVSDTIGKLNENLQKIEKGENGNESI